MIRQMVKSLTIHRINKLDDREVNTVNENFENIEKKIDELAQKVEELSKKEES